MTPPDFDTVYRQGFRYVFRTLRRLGVRLSEVDDLVQEVFTVVLRRLSDYEPGRPLEPWLFGITFRVASTHHRARSRRVVEVMSGTREPDDFSDEDAPGPETSLADRQARRLVLEALQALDLDRRAVLVMHDIDGLAVPAIAEVLGVPTNTVYTRLRAARARFTSRVRQLQLRSRRSGGGEP